MIDERIFSIYDDFLIRAAHDESIYDILLKVAEVDLDVICGLLTDNELSKLKRYHSITIKGSNAKKILDALGVSIPNSNIWYIVIRLDSDESSSEFEEI